MAQFHLNQQYSLYFQRVHMLYQKPEIKASLEIILSVFTVTLLIFFAIRPTITNIFALQKKIVDQEVVLKKTDNKINQLISAQKQLSDNGEDVNLINEAVPDNFNYFDYAKRMDIIARKNNVSLDGVNFPGSVMTGKDDLNNIPKEKAKNYVLPDKEGQFTVKIGFQVLGDQAGVFNFLADLENMDRVALVDSIEVTKTQKSVQETKQTLSVTGQVYFYAIMVKQ